MKLTLKRIFNCKNYCIGHIYVDGQYICDTIEDTDRMLDQSMPLAKIKSIKVKSETAIPTGTYKILMNIVSPKFSLKQYYMDVCKGKVPRLANVPGYDGILIHCGTNQYSSAGCLIVGYNKIRGRVVDSKPVFEKLFAILKTAYNKGEEITITITRSYGA